LYECDVCGDEGQRYGVIFPEGQMTLDRCGRHNRALERLREEKGSWVAKTSNGRTSFKVSSIDEIERLRK
jgi:hypothetical protein